MNLSGVAGATRVLTSLLLTLPHTEMLKGVCKALQRTPTSQEPTSWAPEGWPGQACSLEGDLIPARRLPIPPSPPCEPEAPGFGLTWQCRRAQRQTSPSSGSCAHCWSCFHAPPCGQRTLSERKVYTRFTSGGFRNLLFHYKLEHSSAFLD